MPRFRRYRAPHRSTHPVAAVLAAAAVAMSVVTVASPAAAKPCPIVGTEADETRIGTPGDDKICGKGGNDTLIG